MINNVTLLTQNDPLWRFKIMTSPPWQRYKQGKRKGEKDPDFIYEYGCLITALVNAYNLFKKQNILTPALLNLYLKNNRGYNYLKNGIKSKGAESFLLWDVACPILGIAEKIDNYKGGFDFDSPYDFYIARAFYKKTGHYCLITGGNPEKPKFFDSFTGKTRCEKVTRIIKITFSEGE